MQTTLDWHQRHITSMIVFECRRDRNTNRKCDILFPNLPLTVFDKLFLKFNHPPAIDFVQDKNQTKWFNQSSLPPTFMPDHFNFGNEFIIIKHNEKFAPYCFQITYFMSGKLKITFHIKWQVVGSTQWVSLTPFPNDNANTISNNMTSAPSNFVNINITNNNMNSMNNNNENNSASKPK